MRIAVGCDHGGLELKQKIAVFLRSRGHSVKDFGTFSGESCDYPVFAKKVARAVASGKCRRGVLICKSGIGMEMAANKIRSVRAANIRDLESAVLSRQHNDANIITFGSKFVSYAKAKNILRAWLKTRFLKGRHKRRVRQIG